mmetsp:Transcript_76258/g.200056  ORF Transcript_76258/g.200056 Transcript_76258/m.200056 type:complete len:498 (-) Transcript_76258:1025-2518(-)
MGRDLCGRREHGLDRPLRGRPRGLRVPQDHAADAVPQPPRGVLRLGLPGAAPLLAGVPALGEVPLAAEAPGQLRLREPRRGEDRGPAARVLGAADPRAGAGGAQPGVLRHPAAGLHAGQDPGTAQGDAVAAEVHPERPEADPGLRVQAQGGREEDHRRADHRIPLGRGRAGRRREGGRLVRVHHGGLRGRRPGGLRGLRAARRARPRLRQAADEDHALEGLGGVQEVRDQQGDRQRRQPARRRPHGRPAPGGGGRHHRRRRDHGHLHGAVVRGAGPLGVRAREDGGCRRHLEVLRERLLEGEHLRGRLPHRQPGGTRRTPQPGPLAQARRHAGHLHGGAEVRLRQDPDELGGHEDGQAGGRHLRRHGEESGGPGRDQGEVQVCDVRCEPAHRQEARRGLQGRGQVPGRHLLRLRQRAEAPQVLGQARHHRRRRRVRLREPAHGHRARRQARDHPGPAIRLHLPEVDRHDRLPPPHRRGLQHGQGGQHDQLPGVVADL